MATGPQGSALSAEYLAAALLQYHHQVDLQLTNQQNARMEPTLYSVSSGKAASNSAGISTLSWDSARKVWRKEISGYYNLVAIVYGESTSGISYILHQGDFRAKFTERSGSQVGCTESND